MFWRLKYAADTKLQCRLSVEPEHILEECFKNVSFSKCGNIASHINCSTAMFFRQFLKEGAYVDLRRFFPTTCTISILKKGKKNPDLDQNSHCSEYIPIGCPYLF